MAPARRSRWTTQRKVAWASIACADIPALIVLLESTLTDFGGPDMPWVWWSAFGLFIATIMLIYGILPRPRRVPVNALIIVHVVLAMTLVSFYPEQGWNALLFVVTAATMAYFWRLRVVVIVATVQTATVGVVFASAGWSLVDVLMGIFAYANFQVFGALVMFAVRGETDARSELAVAHAELRATAALLDMTSREAERLRIARDLHDLAGHHLTALSLELEVLTHLVQDDAGQEHVNRASAIARELLGSVRSVVSEMREETVSMESALRSLAGDIATVDVSVRVLGSVPIRAEHAAIIMRCVQEAITNCLRHSHARCLDILVDAGPRDIRISITDDGNGSAEVTHGNGLTGMTERFESVGGTLDVRSQAGAGFSIVGTIPVMDEPAGARRAEGAAP